MIKKQVPSISGVLNLATLLIKKLLEILSQEGQLLIHPKRKVAYSTQYLVSDWVNQIESAFVSLVVENSGLVNGLVAVSLFAVSSDRYLDVPG